MQIVNADVRTLEEVLIDDTPVLLGDYHAGRMEFKGSAAVRSSWCSVDDPRARSIRYALRIDARTSPARATGHTVSISATL